MEETLSNNKSKSINAMSHSESYEDCVSNEENLKRSIPYIKEQNEEPEERNTYGTLDDDHEDDVKSYGYQNWDADDEYRDEIKSRVGLDYSIRNDSGKYFAAPYSQGSNLKHSVEGMVFRPPTASTPQYNCNYPHPSAHLHRQKYTPGYSTSITPQPSTSAQALGFVASPNFHPNMWYPNAPYGSGSFYPQYGQNRFPHYGAGYPHDQLADMHQLSNSGREARNRAEKNRRDKLNGSIQELSTMVPHVAESPRRVDKTAVLRFAAHGLRLQYAFRKTINAARPELTDTLMRLMDSFFLTITCHGQIILISSSIEQHLGYCQADLYGQNILHITHPEDHDMIKRQLIPSDIETLFDIQPDDNSDEPIQRTQEEEDYIDQKLLEDKRSFTVRFARAGPRSEPTTYEVCKVEGCFRRSDAAPRGSKTSTSPAGLQLIRRTQRRDEAIPLTTISGNDIALVAVARIVRPAKIDNTIIETNLEYRTRHLIDGRIIDCDQRIGIVAGYMTDEVRNLSPFTFMHQDDVRWVIVALRQMYDCNSSYGESTYRLLTRNGYFIYLQSKGYLEIDKETNTVHSFVCVNTLLDEEEGKRRVHEMKKKFSVIINNQIPSSTPSTENVPASQNPQQLVKAVLCLIQNLQKTSSDDEEGNGCTSHFDSSLQIKPDPSLPSRSMSSSSMRLTKTPPLALVPPEVSSVETSISKSVSVVNDTSAKYLRGNQLLSPRCSKSPLANEESVDDSTESFSCSCQYQNNGSECEVCEKSKNRISNLKRTLSCTESEDLKLPKRRLKSTEIHQVIFSSLDQLGRSLQKQQNAAIELRDQTNKFEVPNSKNRIKEIMDECQKQNEMYVNITSEIQNQAIDAITTKTEDPQITDDLHPT